MSKRLIALLLALVMCVGLLAACGGNGDDTTGSTETKGNETPGSTGAAYVRPDMTGVKIEHYAKDNPDMDYETTWLYGQVEKLLGVEIDYIEGADGAMLIAEHKPPQLMSVNGMSSTDVGYGDDGAIVNIYDHLDKMPNVKAWLEDPANAANVEKWTAREGVMYHIPVSEANSVGGIGNIYTFLYREDIFKANNLTWPTNQEEFVNVLRTLKNLYPSSYPFVLRNLNKTMPSYFGHLWGGSHVLNGWYNSIFTMGADGKYYLGTTSQVYKEMAQFVKDLLAEGLMHPSTMTISAEEWQNALANGTSFITYDKVDRLPILNPAGLTQDANYRLIAGAPFNFGSYAKTTNVVSTAFGNEPTTTYAYMIGNTANIDNVCKYVDWLFSEEGRLLTNWGIEGESYEVDTEGNKTFKADFIANNGGNLNKTGLNHYAMCGVTDFKATIASYEDYIADSLTLATQYMTGGVVQPVLKYNETEQATFDTYRKPLYDYALGEFCKFILGQRDFAEWDQVTQELKNIYHYDEVLKIHEDAAARAK